MADLLTSLDEVDTLWASIEACFEMQDDDSVQTNKSSTSLPYTHDWEDLSISDFELQSCFSESLGQHPLETTAKPTHPQSVEGVDDDIFLSVIPKHERVVPNIQQKSMLRERQSSHPVLDLATSSLPTAAEVPPQPIILSPDALCRIKAAISAEIFAQQNKDKELSQPPAYILSDPPLSSTDFRQTHLLNMKSTTSMVSSSSFAMPKTELAIHKESHRPKRPANAFILWSCEERKKGNYSGSPANYSSAILRDKWAKLPKHEKALWQDKSRALFREFRRKYPDLSYHPQRHKNTGSARKRQTVQATCMPRHS